MTETKETKEKTQQSVLITRRVQVICVSEDKQKIKEFNTFIKELDNASYRIANAIMAQYYVADALSEALVSEELPEDKKSFWKVFGKAKREKTKELQERIWEMSQQNIGYHYTKLFPNIPSAIRSALSNKVYQDFTNDLKDVKLGKRSQRTYKKGMATPFSKTSILNLRLSEVKSYVFEWFGFPVALFLGRDRSSNRAIINRILSGEYELCDSSIQYAKGKTFLNLCVRLPKQQKQLQPDVEAQADITFLVPILVRNSKTEEVVEVGNKLLADGTTTMQNLFALRNQMNYRRQAVQQSVKTAKGGHGRKRKLKAVTNIDNLEKRIARTENHKITKWVIDEVLKMQASKLVISRRKLSEQESERRFQMRYWGYAEIIGMLKYKAAKYGIEVIDRTDSDSVAEEVEKLLQPHESISEAELVMGICDALEVDEKTAKQRLTYLVSKRKPLHEHYYLFRMMQDKKPHYSLNELEDWQKEERV